MDSSWDDLSVPWRSASRRCGWPRCVTTQAFLLMPPARPVACVPSSGKTTKAAARSVAEMAVDVARQLKDKSVLCEVLIYLNFSQPDASKSTKRRSGQPKRPVTSFSCARCVATSLISSYARAGSTRPEAL